MAAGVVNIQYPGLTLSGPGSSGRARKPGPACTLINESGQMVQLPITAPTTQYGELADNWTQVARPGLIAAAYNVKGPRPLRAITLQVTVVDPQDVLAPIDDLLSEITLFLQNANAIRVAYSTFDDALVTKTGLWVCTSWQPAVLTRDPDTHSPISAQGNIVLTEANPQPFSSLATAVTTTSPGFTAAGPASNSIPLSSTNT